MTNPAPPPPRVAARLAVVAALLVLPAAAEAADVELVPDARIDMKAARYAPGDPDLHWTGWVGAGLGLLRVSGVTGYFAGDIETTLGGERRAFDATQANYHLEVGFRRELGPTEVGMVFHHVSRHLSDRPKEQAVDWNVLGLRATRRFADRLDVSVGLGRAIQESLVGYRWEATGHADADLLRRGRGSLYARLDLRAVRAESSEAFPREGFLDVLAEAGARTGSGPRRLDVFVAFELRHDVRVLEGGSRDRALLGFRLAQLRESPGGVLRTRP